MFGIGAAYNFNKNVSAVAEYEYFGKVLTMNLRVPEPMPATLTLMPLLQRCAAGRLNRTLFTICMQFAKKCILSILEMALKLPLLHTAMGKVAWRVLRSHRRCVSIRT
jgi:hypothetical protein